VAELGQATFASSVRSNRVGAGTELARGLPRLTVDVSLKVTGHWKGGGTDEQDASARLELLGPGDVVGIAPSEILRVFPNTGEYAAEPNYLAAIEFDSPELPWLVSLSDREPARPWIALVVVPDNPGRVSDQAGSLLPWLVADPAELPPPDELWAWAHAHAQGDAPLESPAHDGRRTLSRLLCPTRLRANTAYLAAVVPTYLAGVLAARRQNPDGAGDKASWPQSQGTIELPMYHHWRFVTGAAGDFEEVARQLSPIDASLIDGLGRIDLRLAEHGLDPMPPQELKPVRTLLVSPAEDAARDVETPVLDGEVPEAIEAAVDAKDDDERVVRPPRYGQWPTGDARVRGGPDWYAELNLQPHHRVVARLGADMVRAQQEELVAEARRQLGEYRAARRIRDLLRLGEMTATRLYERAVANALDERLVTVARPVLRTLVADADTPVVETMAAKGFGMSLLAASFARIAQRVSAKTGIPAARMRAEFVAGAMKGDLVALRAAEARPRIHVDRVRTAFTRAGILDQQVGGVRVDQLITLTPPALVAQDQLVAEFRGVRIEVEHVDPPPPDDGDGAADLLDRAPDIVRRRLPGPRPEIGDALRRLRQVGAFDAAAEERVGRAITVAVTPLLHAAAERGLPDTPTWFTDLVVDQHTFDLAVAFQQGDEPVVTRLNVRNAVRRSLGLRVFGPVPHDQLTEEGQRQFDDVVATLSARQVSQALRFPVAPPRVTVDQVAARCRSGLLVRTTFTVAAGTCLPRVLPRLVPSLIPMGFVPTFNAPLAARLQRTHSQWVMAGADRVPPNSITVVMTNPAFVEAFTVGANHEMARELLWRGVPSDARGTVFRRFWTTGRHQGEKDLRPIHDWTRSLGKTLVVRSPLLRRYPNAVLQAAQGQLLGTPDGRNFEPDPATFKTLLFQGAIAPDITFSVIDLTEKVVRDAPANRPWYLLLGEPVTEPKFGLDTEATGAARPLTTWRDLAWTDTVNDAVLRVGDANLAHQEHDGVTWGTDAAAMARILHQDPFRLVLPALDFLGREG